MCLTDLRIISQCRNYSIWYQKGKNIEYRQIQAIVAPENEGSNDIWGI